MNIVLEPCTNHSMSTSWYLLNIVSAPYTLTYPKLNPYSFIFKLSSIPVAQARRRRDWCCMPLHALHDQLISSWPFPIMFLFCFDLIQISLIPGKISPGFIWFSHVLPIDKYVFLYGAHMKDIEHRCYNIILSHNFISSNLVPWFCNGENSLDNTGSFR